MRIMTYNILEGAADRTSEVVDVINKAKPDVLLINEANNFDLNDDQILHSFADLVGLPNFYLDKDNDPSYHVAIFSKVPFIKIQVLKPVLRGMISGTLPYDSESITIVALHLNPFSEDERIKEVRLLLNIIQKEPRLVVMGDFNALSANDIFTDKQLQSLPESFKNKFAKHGALQYDVYEFLAGYGLIDIALQAGDLGSTIPTQIGNTAHPPVRLDRALVSPSLAPHVTHYEVIKNISTSRASDHYPVVIDISA